MSTSVDVSSSQVLSATDSQELHQDSSNQKGQFKPRAYGAATGLLLSVPLFMYPKPKYISVSAFRQPINIVRPIKALCTFAAGITFVLACASVREAGYLESKPMGS